VFPDDKALQEAKRCFACGFCLSVCPVYRVLGVETLSSRGRVDTVRGYLKGDLGLSPRMQEILSCCLLCRACESACPPGVAVHKVILEGRHRAVIQNDLPRLKRWALHRLLRDRRLLERSLKLAAFLQAGRPPPQGTPVRHLPTWLSGASGGRGLPRIARQPLRKRAPRLTPSRTPDGHKGRIALFSGCYLDFADTKIGEAGLRVLAAQGYDVLFPLEQVCCGAPVLYSGDLDGATELARINAEAFAQAELAAVVTLCATCGSTLKEGYQTIAGHLAGDDRRKILSFSDKVVDFSELLAGRGGVAASARGTALTVTYHDPCHHVRGLKIRNEPRELLQSIPGIRLHEMAQPERCCGGGGSFGLSHPEASLTIGRWKVRDILATGCEAVVTSCPGCILQIQDVAHREKANFRVMHLAEILDLALLSGQPPVSNRTIQPTV
jgi:glycolate oxidase iron-sulfur subunit